MHSTAAAASIPAIALGEPGVLFLAALQLSRRVEHFIGNGGFYRGDAGGLAIFRRVGNRFRREYRRQRSAHMDKVPGNA